MIGVRPLANPGAIGAGALCLLIGSTAVPAQTGGWVQTQPSAALSSQCFQPGSGLNLKPGDAVALISQPRTYLYRMRSADIRGQEIYFLERSVQKLAAFTGQTQFYNEACSRIAQPDFLRQAQAKGDVIVEVVYQPNDPYRGKVIAIRPGTTAPLAGWEARFC